MTRGQIAIITPEGKILTSAEFNGNMDYEGHGQDVYDDLESVDTVEEYKEFVRQFNDDNFHYEDQLFYGCDDSFFDMQNDYFGKWFSDYVYVKNLFEKPVVVTDRNGKKIQLDNDTTAVFNFGEFIAENPYDFELKAFMDELEAKKKDLRHNSTSENYSEIWNMCADFDNEHRYLNLTERIMEHGYITEEIVEYLVKEKATDLYSLRCFINDTEEDDIYILDDSGDLQNVTESDFEELIDDLIYDLECKITIPLAKQEACL